MAELLNLVGAQSSPTVMLVIGAIAMLIAMTLLRLVRRIRRMIWTVTVLAAASGMGLGGGWAAFDGLTTAL
ncbi:hypothetical protein AB4Z39_05235 [Mycobacterium adipatum]|uniref:hypothetical protein n=1 Tax=Mycobacterium adipatum TaxID=1682113 RepID=UPI0034E0A836